MNRIPICERAAAHADDLEKAAEHIEWCATIPEDLEAAATVKRIACAIRYEANQAAKLIESLMDMVAECAITFEHYAELHAAKGTAEGQLKAKRNRKKANECRSVLSQAHTEVLSK
jgi:hypothetical protein